MNGRLPMTAAIAAAELDATGDKPRRCHGDVRFNRGKTARLEVDAVSARMDVRTAQGKFVRLRIDPMTRHVAARNPASLED